MTVNTVKKIYNFSTLKKINNVLVYDINKCDIGYHYLYNYSSSLKLVITSGYYLLLLFSIFVPTYRDIARAIFKSTKYFSRKTKWRTLTTTLKERLEWKRLKKKSQFEFCYNPAYTDRLGMHSCKRKVKVKKINSFDENLSISRLTFHVKLLTGKCHTCVWQMAHLILATHNSKWPNNARENGTLCSWKEVKVEDCLWPKNVCLFHICLANVPDFRPDTSISTDFSARCISGHAKWTLWAAASIKGCSISLISCRTIGV